MIKVLWGKFLYWAVILAVENMGGERRGSLIWFWLSCLIVCLLFGFSKGTICTYCGKDFKVLGRHIWSCKSRVIINSPVITPSNNPSVSTQGVRLYRKSKSFISKFWIITMGKSHPKLVLQTMTLNCKMKRPTLAHITRILIVFVARNVKA